MMMSRWELTSTPTQPRGIRDRGSLDQKVVGLAGNRDDRVAGHQQAGVLVPPPEDLTPGSSLAPSDLMRPSLRAESDSALELTEIATYTLPPGMAVAGAALSPDGARLVVWGSRPKSVLYFERGLGGGQLVSRELLATR